MNLAPSSPAPTAAEPLIRVEHVFKRHRLGEVEVVALKDVSVTIGQGEFVVILGPSGSGKTSLLNIIGGLDTPTEGTAIVAGRNLTGANEAILTAYRRDVVGFIFQFYNLIPTLTARENVALVGELVPDAQDPDKMLDLVGLSARATAFPQSLSGGEQQRVAIARALVKRPKLVLADEPTGALDFDTSIRVLRVLHESVRTVGCAVVLVSHNEEIARMADRVIRITSGQVIGDIHNPNPAAPEDLHW